MSIPIVCFISSSYVFSIILLKIQVFPTLVSPKNMTLAIEPMANMGSIDVYTCDDEWTVKSKDGSMTSHYENTILITDNGPEILSLVV